MKRIWGISFEDINSGDYIFRRIIINNPFMENGEWFVGLNEKFLNDVIDKRIHRLVLKIGKREILIKPPNKKEIKKLKFEMKKSMFENSPDLKIYHYPL